MRLFSLLTALSLCAAPVQAQTIEFSIDPTLACIEEARRAAERPLCIGEAARACYTKPGSARPNPMDVSLCMAEETQYWTGRMSAALAEMKVKAQAADEEFQKTAMSEKVPFLLTEDLGLMQESWQVWREKRCAFEAMLRRGTPYAATAAANCMMQQTGRQALFLESAVRH